MTHTDTLLDKIRKLSSLIQHELDVIANGDPGSLGEIIESKEALANSLHASSSEIEQMIKTDEMDGYVLRSALQDLKRDIRRNTDVVAHLAKSFREIISDIESGGETGSIRGLYNNKGETARSTFSRPKEVDFSI